MSVIVFSGNEISDWYVPALMRVMQDGDRVSPRGKPNRELRLCVLQTSTWQTLAKAGVDYKFALAEAMAVICGWNDVKWLKRFNPRIDQFSDDGRTFHGSYGVRMNNQLDHVIERLKLDNDSRQAVVNIWMGADSWTASKDLPCNTQVYLKIRNGRLDLTVMRRSADLIWGVPYDHHVFFALLTVVASELGVAPGVLTEVIDSLHVYEPEANFYDEGRVGKALLATKREMFPHWFDVAGMSLGCVRSTLAVVRCQVEGYRARSPHPLVTYLEEKVAK